jgi:DNA-binding ferritin-like protein
MRSLQKPGIFSISGASMSAMMPQAETCAVCIQTAALAQDLLNAVTSIHKIHLKITGLGSFAAHKALNEFYDEIGDHADSIVEQFQVAEEKLLEMPNTAPTELNSVEETIDYLRTLKDKTAALQSIMPHSEIVNQLDEVKSLIDSTKYKLLFLK